MEPGKILPTTSTGIAREGLKEKQVRIKSEAEARVQEATTQKLPETPKERPNLRVDPSLVKEEGGISTLTSKTPKTPFPTDKNTPEYKAMIKRVGEYQREYEEWGDKLDE